MSEQMIEVTISNREMAKADVSTIDFIMGKLVQAGVPVIPHVPGQAIKAKKGILMYNRSSMAEASVYTWQSDDYVRGHDNEDTTDLVVE